MAKEPTITLNLFENNCHLCGRKAAMLVDGESTCLPCIQDAGHYAIAKGVLSKACESGRIDKTNELYFLIHPEKDEGNTDEEPSIIPLGVDVCFACTDQPEKEDPEFSLSPCVQTCECGSPTILLMEGKPVCTDCLTVVSNIDWYVDGEYLLKDVQSAKGCIKLLSPRDGGWDAASITIMLYIGEHKIIIATLKPNDDLLYSIKGHGDDPKGVWALDTAVEKALDQWCVWLHIQSALL